MARSEDARHWLRENGYKEIADSIEVIIGTWKQEGNRTRRNWWDILAGDHLGRSRKVAGVNFPVLRAAQRRQGRRLTPNAISLKKREKVPKAWVTGRWIHPESAE